jgi:hypothetical protein
MASAERVRIQALASDEFGLSLPPAPNARVLRKLLRNHPTVRALDDAMRVGSTSDSEIDEFVSGLLDRFRRGERFQHSDALAAIAVLLEPRFSSLAHAYLRELASLRLEELRSAIDVAKLCRQARAGQADNRTRLLRLVPPSQMNTQWSQSPFIDERRTTHQSIATELVCEPRQQYG